MTNKNNIVSGDLIELALKGQFDVIIQGNNCFNRQQSGLAEKMVKVFKTDTFPMEQIGFSDRTKLGKIDYKAFKIQSNYAWRCGLFETPNLYVVNCYTQYKYGSNHEDGDEKPVDYSAIFDCLLKVNETFKGLRIGIPYVIGCGLAGGDKEKVLDIIERTLTDVNYFLVKLEK